MSSRFVTDLTCRASFCSCALEHIRPLTVCATNNADTIRVWGRIKVTSLDKSDIVSKAASLHLQESITMPEQGEPKAEAGAAKESMMPVDDPIGAALRRLHDEVVAEPLPEDFLRLLGEIERKLDGASPSE